MAKKNISRPSLWERIQFIALGPRDFLLSLICLNYKTFIWGFERLPPLYLAWTSYVRARRAFYRSIKNVPAYAHFISKSNVSDNNIPETDKQSYITAYPPEKRCVGGIIPAKCIMIDESSGSTGVPYNWIRTLDERTDSHLFISYFSTYCFGSGSWITINAFSMGAWATGLNMGLALQRNSIVKNTGPDLSKTFSTLSFFGSKYPYLILGYPPFLKQLIDAAEVQGFPLREYSLNALVGGEGMSEGLRDYLLKHFKNVYSGYGATGLELGVAGETPLSVAIRRLARDDTRVYKQLFGEDSRLPMVFQFNPLMHYIEVNDNRELIFTITRASLLSPRIRYNVHDEGGVARYDEVATQLAAVGYDIEKIVKQENRLLRLPFLWVYGRRDFTISVMGANIYPEDLEHCLYAEPHLAKITRSFCQTLSESPSGDVRPLFLFEITAEPSEVLKELFLRSILGHLIKLNADFREAWQEHQDTLIPEIQLYRVGEGPFKQDSQRIKQVRKI